MTDRAAFARVQLALSERGLSDAGKESELRDRLADATKRAALFNEAWPGGLAKGSGFVVLPRTAVESLIFHSAPQLKVLRELFALEKGFKEYDPFERVYASMAINHWVVDPATWLNQKSSWISKYVQWGGKKRKCHGRKQSGSHPCVLAIGDLPYLVNSEVADRSSGSCADGDKFTPVCASRALFASKFDPTLDARVVECLRENFLAAGAGAH